MKKFVNRKRKYLVPESTVYIVSSSCEPVNAPETKTTGYSDNLFHTIMTTRKQKLDRAMQDIIDSKFDTDTNEAVKELIDFEKLPKLTPINKNYFN